MFQVVDRIVVMRRGRVVADAIDPRTTSVEAVEQVITGMTADGGRSPGRRAGGRVDRQVKTMGGVE